MHFYDFNIGDYAKKTSHLTNGEDLAYRRALDVYYDTEQPFDITHGLATLSRRLRVDEKDLKNVIEEFFPDGRNKCADEKIAAYYAFLDRQKANGKKGGRPKHKDLKPSANPVVSQNNPVPSQPLPTTHLPNTNTLVASYAGRPTCPHEQIISLYHELLPTLPAVKVWNEKRKTALKSRWLESEDRQTLDFWRRYFSYVATSDFLCGRVGTFQATLEWLVNSSNFVKVIEGNYENRK
jgi:uncharacterized protein YdaU (DUF1376 family)